MALGLDETATIYRTGYWDRVRADELPAGVDLVVFDAAVNSGPARAIRWLQNAAGVAADGVIGSATLAAVRRAEPGDIVTAIMRQRLAFLQRLRTWPSFGKGWGRRVRAIETAALAMAGQGVVTSSARPGASIAMNDTKSLLTSRTLWSNLVGLTAVMASLFGLDMSGVDSAGLSQAIPQAVAAVSFIASTIFRVTATKRIAMP